MLANPPAVGYGPGRAGANPSGPAPFAFQRTTETRRHRGQNVPPWKTPPSLIS